MIMRAWFVLLGIAVHLVGFAAQLTQLEIKQQANKTSLFFTVNGPFTHKIFTLANPNRVVIDFSDTRLGLNLRAINKNTSLISQVRGGRPNPKTLRLVFDVNQPVRISSLPWQNRPGSYGMKVDFVARGAPIAVRPKPLHVNTTQTPIKVVQNSRQSQSGADIVKHPIIAHHTPIKVPHSPVKSLRDVVVVLDAGHGGKDPGAKGPRHSQEKRVVLAITLKLKQLIDKQPGMRAVLTRSGDYYVGLRKRLDIARKYNGDVFVSIHADAFNNPHSNGASVFALSQRGATSEAARWLAEKENYSELGGVNLGDLDDQNGVVRSVLIDLSQTATINSGLQMGKQVLRQLNGFTNLHNYKVEQARFVVLKSPDIPSILVETGFISNPREEMNLNNPAYQARLSQAIFNGIKGYFWDNPPHGSRIEALTSSRFHIVRSGETLPMIAARYHVSLSTLTAANHLQSNRPVRSGQKLVIPSAWA